MKKNLLIGAALLAGVAGFAQSCPKPCGFCPKNCPSCNPPIEPFSRLFPINWEPAVPKLSQPSNPVVPMVTPI